jgi:hypothetical protein
MAANVTAGLLCSAILAVIAFVVHHSHHKGCAPYGVYLQNRWEAYGARILDAPEPLATKIGGFAPNEIITVDGWVHGTVPYPNNVAPNDSDIWFRTADHRGWVAFAAVRGLPISHATAGDTDGGTPAAAPASCEIDT